MSQVLTLPEVLKETKLSRSALYVMLDRGEFPRPFKLGERKNAWLRPQVDGWLQERAARAQDETGAKA